jgi:hypothetical protein
MKNNKHCIFGVQQTKKTEFGRSTNEEEKKRLPHFCRDICCFFVVA